MKNVSLLLGLAAALGTLLPACTVRTRARPVVVSAPAPQPAPPPPPQPATTTTVVGGGASASIQVQTPILGAGVTVVSPTCGGPETCDGIDNDCDGVIDEGCGWQGGNIQVTLAWQTGADLDLYVTDPTGQTISYRNRHSGSGGHLDQDARGACTGSGPTIENVYYDSPRPPPGRYQIDVHYYSPCRVAGVTPATVSIAVGGRNIGTYGLQIGPNQRQTIAYFDMP
jgi:hypothetical protein